MLSRIRPVHPTFIEKEIEMKSRGFVSAVAAFLCLGLAACAGYETSEQAKIPITTASEEARELYLAGRELQDKLRVTDAREYYRQAIEKDESFALAHLALADTSPTANEFFESLERAVALAEQASEAEREMILGLDAGVRGRPEEQKRHYERLVEQFPDDERGHNLLAGYYFGRQEYEPAIEHYDHATSINPEFSPSYNSVGYAHRFLEQYDEAEQAFRTYIELIPEEPNPYDSYAELLMKVGRFDESIENYEKALSFDPNFVTSYVGIGNNRMLMGQTDEARTTFEKMSGIARNSGEKRQAHFWMATSFIHDGDHDAALEQVKEMYRLAEQDEDFNTMSGDLVLMGNILIEGGDVEESLVMFAKALEVGDRAEVPDEVKEATHRNHLFNLSRAALAKDDLDAAKTHAAAYREQVEAMQIPFELRQSHEVAGMLALAEKDWAAALAELEQANQQNPRVLYLMALACHGQGDLERARTLGAKAAEFNGLAINFAFIREKARKLLDDIG